MDSIILSLAIKLYKKLVSFMKDYQSDIFGAGSSGNVYVGDNDDELPAGYKQWYTTGTYTLKESDVPHFENLIIGTNRHLTGPKQYLFLYVRDTLTIKVGGSVNLNSKSSGGSFTYSPFMPRAGASYSTPSYTAACIKLLLSGRDIRTDLDLLLTGSNASNGTGGIAGAGTSGGSGGLVCVYTKTDGLNAYNTETETTQPVERNYVTANGGASGTVGGGMLFIFAHNIIIERDTADNHGTISANGGDGQGSTSFLGENPGPRINATTGGGGVVHHVELDVL